MGTRLPLQWEITQHTNTSSGIRLFVGVTCLMEVISRPVVRAAQVRYVQQWSHEGMYSTYRKK
jgi:hypothetical protein